MKLILALDAGTSGVRTVAFGHDLEVVDGAYLELTQHFPAPGEVEDDPGEIARLAVSTLRDVAASVAGLEVSLWSSLDELSERWRAVARYQPEEPTIVDAGYTAWRRALARA